IKETEIIYTFGISYRVAPNWYAGLEARHETEYGALNTKKSSRDFAISYWGPTIHYGAKDWFVTAAYQRQLPNAKVYNDEIADWEHQRRLYGDEATRNELRFKLGYYF